MALLQVTSDVPRCPRPNLFADRNPKCQTRPTAAPIRRCGTSHSSPSGGAPTSRQPLLLRTDQIASSGRFMSRRRQGTQAYMATVIAPLRTTCAMLKSAGRRRGRATQNDAALTSSDTRSGPAAVPRWLVVTFRGAVRKSVRPPVADRAKVDACQLSRPPRILRRVTPPRSAGATIGTGCRHEHQASASSDRTPARALSPVEDSRRRDARVRLLMRPAPPGHAPVWLAAARCRCRQAGRRAHPGGEFDQKRCRLVL